KHLQIHPSGVKVLAGPHSMDVITPEILSSILENLKKVYDFIIIDTEQCFSEITTLALDLTEVILLIMDLSIPTIRNISLCLDNFKALYYPQEKVRLIVNQANTSLKLNESDVSKHLQWPISVSVPENRTLVLNSANSGTPFVLSNPNDDITKNIIKIVEIFAKDDLLLKEESKPTTKKGWFNKK
ncbi:MAG: hypothetical protein ABIH39_04980, partial [Candidatus Margulisiibacteriota bacterium]